MKKKIPNPNKIDKLRKQAEEKLKDETFHLDGMSDEELQKIIHELHVNQIELEMQNEELRLAQNQLEESRSRYADLYDFAPIGYFVLDRNGLILDLNFTGANLLGMKRDNIVKKPFHLFVARQDQDRFYAYRRKIFETDTQLNCELKLIKKNGDEFYVLLESHAVKDSQGNLSQCRTSISDLTERKKTEDALKLHEMRLQALLDLNKMTEASQQMILDFVREEVIKVTQSQFAFIGFMNNDESVMAIDNWSKKTMSQCAIIDKPMKFSIAEAGLWGEPVRQRRPVIVNDYNAPHPVKKGFPQGHVPIERFLVIPVFDGDHIVAVVAVANKVHDYDESDIRSIESMMNDTWRLIRRKRAEEALQRSEERYALAQRAAKTGSWDWNIESGSLQWSESIEPLFGFAQGEFGATYEAFLECVHPDDRQYVIDSVNACVEDGKDYAVEHRIIWPNRTVRWVAETGDVIRDKNGKAIRMLGVVQDITKRKDREVHRQLSGKILKCLNRENVGVDLISNILKFIKQATGLDAVGIRQQGNGDFPYFEVDGFPDYFVKYENHLCNHNECGELIYDSNGRPILECMCGIVLSGRTDPSLPFFTEGGSFWTNSTSELLTDIIREAFQVPIRNRCKEAGYESVALIPLRSGDKIVGLLQLNDTRKGCFTTEMVQFFEEIGASIGIGLARIRIEQEVENLAKFPSENPYPVLRIAKDGIVLYANSTGSDLLENWGSKVGEQAPEDWQDNILLTLQSGHNKKFEAACRDRIFSLVITPVLKSGYANIYGSDITERKRAEESLRKYQQRLEDLVQTRTLELTETNKRLLLEIESRKRLEKEILNISEREQKRIGQELHDSIGQQFTGIAFMTKVLEQKLTKKLPDEAADATEIKKLVNQAMDQARSLARGLHPVDLNAGSLMSALQELAVTTENLFGIHCSFKYNEPIPIDDPETATHLYRITQEAITNAIKHGNTSNIQIELDQQADKSVLKVENDGLDFPEEFEVRGTGMGLQIMDHRADIIGATLDIHKAPRGGTILTCSFINNITNLNTGINYGPEQTNRQYERE